MIRRATIEDKAKLCDIFSEVINMNLSYISHGELQMGVALDEKTLATDHREVWGSYIQELIEDDKSAHVFMYEEHGDACGFIVVRLDKYNQEYFGTINDICVKQSARGGGIGGRLMDAAFEWFETQGVKSFYLESGTNNHSAHGFFEKRGFKVVSKIFHKGE